MKFAKGSVKIKPFFWSARKVFKILFTHQSNINYTQLHNLYIAKIGTVYGTRINMNSLLIE